MNGNDTHGLVKLNKQNLPSDSRLKGEDMQKVMAELDMLHKQNTVLKKKLKNYHVS